MRLPLLALTVALTACSGSGGSFTPIPIPPGPGPSPSPGPGPAPPSGQQGSRLVALSGRPVKNRLVYDASNPANRAVTDSDGRFVLPSPPVGAIATNVSDQEQVIVRGLLDRFFFGEAHAATNEVQVVCAQVSNAPANTPIVLAFSQPEATSAEQITQQSRQTTDLVPAMPGEEWVAIVTVNGQQRTQVRGPAGAIYNQPFAFGVPVAIGDVDGDGDPDLYDGVRVVLSDGAGGFSKLPDSPAGSFVVALVDLDEDGKLDLVSADDEVLASPYDVRVRLGDGLGGFGGSIDATALPSAATGIAVGDLDGDANADVFVATRAGAVALFGDGAGTLVASMLATGEYTDIAFADLDGDGVGEVVTLRERHGVEGPLRRFTRSGAVTDTLIFNQVGAPGRFVVRDVSGDGLADVLLFAGALQVCLSLPGVPAGNQAAYSEPGSTLFPGGVSADARLLGDLDGDGVTDFSPRPGVLLRGR